MTKRLINEKTQHLIVWKTPLHRVLIALFVTTIASVFIEHEHFSTALLLSLLWSVFAFSYSLITWITISSQSSSQLRAMAQKEDGSRSFVYSIIIIASLVGMCLVSLLVIHNDPLTSNLYIPVSIAGMLLSWILVHTTFSMHYAHLYYYDDNTNASKHVGGLDFPGDKNPDVLDFAYFSFVIGMTFQVSDVQITSRIMRRTTLLHSLIAFVLNTFVLALTINLIAGLKSN